ncbi:uncharacterized protein LOC124643944 [Helicoverpa zea]|uniref:uncharacterized protein LOC124643944 n=1 Tax=Helicoverpa zea TaxID=7113 RepID=UPI001F5666F5|nr:uncharacterized protein LOC124643944 [Helicoverpa zea]
METEHFDSDLFIDEIQKRPAIWDMESPDYKNKVIKKRNWEELVEIFCDAGDSLEKKKLLGSTLTRKWKSIRDNYIRESKRQKNLPSGSGSSKHVPYVYFAKLKFLESSVVNKDTENNFETPAVLNIITTVVCDTTGTGTTTANVDVGAVTFKPRFEQPSFI